MAETASFWCYQCNRLFSFSDNGGTSMTCPHCNTGFIEAVSNQTTSSPPSPPHPRRRSLGFRRSRRSSSSDNGGDRSPFNPVILLRSPQQSSGDDVSDGGDEGSSGERLYQLYYDDGAGNGLRPLPQTMSELLLGAGFNRLLDQLSQLEVSRSEKPPASKAAIESMPTVEIDACHVSSDLQCAVCYEGFEIGDEAKEMPCQHLYHSDCIIPWLSIRNSCPICRHELDCESHTQSESQPNQIINNNNNNNGDEPVGLTIWRLPGGGYAVGRFSGARRGAREVPVVYREMDGGYNGNNNNGLGRRVVWSATRRNRGSGGGGGGMGRLFGKLASFFRKFTTSSSSSIESVANSIPQSRSVSSSSVFSMYMRRSRRLGHGRGSWDRDG